MIVWFATIGALGAIEIAHAPEILLAFNPWHGVQVFAHHRTAGFLVLGAVVLAITGAEALYADMGHFGRRPIRLAWFAVVLPALLLNYFGQGALLLRMPEAVENPFYLLAPRSLLYPLLVLATLAAIVASQALISGAFSLTHQCVQLRYSPRVSIVHTSRSQAGQIYIPSVNTTLMVGCLLLVMSFRSSTALGAAYGIAVTGTMAITTVLFGVLARQRWHWSLWRIAGVAGACSSSTSRSPRPTSPRSVKAAGSPRHRCRPLPPHDHVEPGTELLGRWLTAAMVPLETFLEDVKRLEPPRVPGTAVFLTTHIEGAPLVLQYHLRHNKAIQEEVLLLAIVTEDVPEVRESRRVKVEALPLGLFRVWARYGFMERADVQNILVHCRAAGIRALDEETTYYLGRMRLMPTGAGADDALAQAPVRTHGSQCQLGRRLFQDSTRSRGGAGRARGVLSTARCFSSQHGDDRQGGRESMAEDFLGVVDQHEAQLLPELLRYILDIALVSAGQDHLADARAMRGQHLLLDPPTGRTLPRRVISPVMARSLRTGRRVASDARAVMMVTPADGPSLGMAPAGTCTWMVRCSKNLGSMSSASALDHT